MTKFFNTIDRFVDKYNLLGIYGIVFIVYLLVAIVFAITGWNLPLAIHIACTSPLCLFIVYIFSRAILINDK